MGLQANVYLLNSIAGEINSIVTKKTVVEKIDSGCGSSYYIKKEIEEKQALSTQDGKPEKRSQNDIYIENIKILKYISERFCDEYIENKEEIEFTIFMFSIKDPAFVDIDHPPQS